MDTYRAVDPADAEEMEPGQEIEEVVLPGATEEAPSPEAEPQETTSRVPQESTEPRKNLDEDPNFRKWKSTMDRQQEELRRSWPRPSADVPNSKPSRDKVANSGCRRSWRS